MCDNKVISFNNKVHLLYFKGNTGILVVKTLRELPNVCDQGAYSPSM